MKVITVGEPMDVQVITMLIYGEPGVGKSTLANTFDNPLVIDFDRGAHRAKNRKLTIQPDSSDEAIRWVEEHQKEFGAVVVDTVGRLIDLMSAEITRGAGPMKIQDWGVLKQRFQLFSSRIRSLGKDLLYVSHAREEKDGDNRFRRPDIVGGSAAEINKACDIIGFMSMRDGERVVDWSPSATFWAKNPCEWPPFVVPSYDQGKTALQEFIQKAKHELGAIGTEGAKSDQLISFWREYLAGVQKEDLNSSVKELLAAKTTKTQKTAIWALFQDRAKVLD